MKKNLSLKKNIKKYQNNEIDINDVVVDKNGNKNYSLKNNFDDILHLLEIANGFIDRNFLFAECFCHSTEEEEEEELKKLLPVFMKKDELLEHFLELENNNEKVKVIINALPFLPEDWLEKNMCFLTENINILEINSEKMRKLYLEEMKKTEYLAGEDVYQNIISSILAYLFNKEDFDINLLENIMSSIELLNNSKRSFFENFKLILPDYYEKEIVVFFNFKVQNPETFNQDFLKNYIAFIEKAMSDANIDMKEIIKPNIEIFEADFFTIEPIVFKAIIDNLKNRALSQNIISELSIMSKKIAENKDFGFTNTQSDFIKNKDYVHYINAEFEKDKILSDLNTIISDKNFNKRL